MLMGVLQRFFQDVVVPELKQIRAENAEIKTTLQLTNKRLDDINVHLADQSRRIDETNKRIDAVHVELIETNNRLNRLYESLSSATSTFEFLFPIHNQRSWYQLRGSPYMPNLFTIGRWLRKNPFYDRHFTVGDPGLMRCVVVDSCMPKCAPVKKEDTAHLSRCRQHLLK